MDFCVGMQSPPQTDVCVQKEPPGQSLAPTTQVCVGTGAMMVLIGGLVAMQRPPQAPEVGQTIVGVHVELTGHPVVALTVQGICGGNTCEVRQRPPQVEVCEHWVFWKPHVSDVTPIRLHSMQFQNRCEAPKMEKHVSRLNDQS